MTQIRPNNHPIGGKKAIRNPVAAIPQLVRDHVGMVTVGVVLSAGGLHAAAHHAGVPAALAWHKDDGANDGEAPHSVVSLSLGTTARFYAAERLVP